MHKLHDNRSILFTRVGALAGGQRNRIHKFSTVLESLPTLADLLKSQLLCKSFKRNNLRKYCSILRFTLSLPDAKFREILRTFFHPFSLMIQSRFQCYLAWNFVLIFSRNLLRKVLYYRIGDRGTKSK